MWFFFLLGIIAFLLMEHPVVFWCVFVPLAVIFVGSMLGFFKKGGGLGKLVTALIILAAMAVVLLIVCIP